MREPDPMAECRPGGSCYCCNPKPLWCQGCLERHVENKDDLCSVCESECDYCGNEIPEGHGRYCSHECARAALE